MKKDKLYLALAILCVWVPLFLGAWDKDKPAASTSLRTSNPQILANWSALETALTQDHEFSTGGTNSGEHKQVKFNAPISTPSNAANKLFIYGKDVGGKIELHCLDEDGNEIQLSSAGGLFSSTTLTVTGESTFNNHVNLGAGDDLKGSSTSDILWNTNKFTVAGATGNTVVAGTLGVTGVATLGDSSQMATSAAPTADADLANKKYVDDSFPDDDAFGAWTSATQGSSTQAASDGFIVVVVAEDIDQADVVTIKTDSANPPTTVRGAIQGVNTAGAGTHSLMCPVKKDDYYLIEDTGLTPTAYFLPVGG